MKGNLPVFFIFPPLLLVLVALPLKAAPNLISSATLNGTGNNDDFLSKTVLDTTGGVLFAVGQPFGPRPERAQVLYHDNRRAGIKWEE